MEQDTYCYYIAYYKLMLPPSGAHDADTGSKLLSQLIFSGETGTPVIVWWKEAPVNGITWHDVMTWVWVHSSPVGHVVRCRAKRPPAQDGESVAESHQRGVLVTVHWLGGGKATLQWRYTRGQRPLWTWELLHRCWVMQRATSLQHHPRILCALPDKSLTTTLFSTFCTADTEDIIYISKIYVMQERKKWIILYLLSVKGVYFRVFKYKLHCCCFFFIFTVSVIVPCVFMCIFNVFSEKLQWH